MDGGRGERFERWKWNGMHKTMCTIYRYCSQLMRLEIRTPPPVSWLLLTDDTLYIWRARAYHQPASSSSTYFAVCMVQWNNDRIRKYSTYVYVAECAIKRPTYIVQGMALKRGSFACNPVGTRLNFWHSLCSKLTQFGLFPLFDWALHCLVGCALPQN